MLISKWNIEEMTGAVRAYKLLANIDKNSVDFIKAYANMPKVTKINPAAKIVMVTAAGQKTNIVEALKRGAADFIQKPFESSAIVSVLEKVMGE